MKPPVSYRVVERREETVDTVSLTLAPSNGGIGGWTPGQFSMIYASGVGEVPIVPPLGAGAGASKRLVGGGGGGVANPPSAAIAPKFSARFCAACSSAGGGVAFTPLRLRHLPSAVLVLPAECNSASHGWPSESSSSAAVSTHSH